MVRDTAEGQSSWKAKSLSPSSSVNLCRENKVVQVIVAFGVFGLRRVDEERSGPLEKTLRLVRTNRLKARTGSWLIGKKFEVVQVVVCEVVLAGVNKQAELQRNKRDGLNSWKTLKSPGFKEAITVFKGRFNTIV